MTPGPRAIHETAMVSAGAELAEGVEVGPYCVIEAGVRVGARTKLLSHVVIATGASLGEDNVVHPFTVLGGAPQDRSYAGEPTTLRIGDGNVIRESVTMNRGTAKDRGETTIGSGGLFLAGAHVAHDCVVGDGATLANGTLLGGHVTLGDHALTGGHVAIQPRVRIGRLAYLAGGAMVEHDVPPFVIASGDRARPRAINRIGLVRRGIGLATIDALERAFRELFRSDEPHALSLARLRTQGTNDPLVDELLAFFR